MRCSSAYNGILATLSEEAPIPFGKYELLERINIGGMAEILKAQDTSRPGSGVLAVKRILPHLTEDRQFATMFTDESRVLAKLQHDNIIHTFEVGEVQHTPYIALEYIYGQDARMLFHRSRRSEQPVPIPVACYVIAQVCAGLHYAHDQRDDDGDLLGLVHRDVSLQNVLLSYDGEVKLTDFGIAMSAENVARTEAGVVKGKFGYMSPEQIKGEPLDRRSDIFATGICLYELLTGERLFSGDSDYAAVERVRNADVPPPSQLNRQIPSALEALVMKALAKSPRDRFQTAEDMRRALLDFMQESHNACSAVDLARYMREAFAEEIRKQPTAEALMSQATRAGDEGTGLAAFDNLDPVSTVTVVPDEPIDIADAVELIAPGRPPPQLQRGLASHPGAVPVSRAPTPRAVTPVQAFGPPVPATTAAPGVPRPVPRRDSVPPGFDPREGTGSGPMMSGPPTPQVPVDPHAVGNMMNSGVGMSDAYGLPDPGEDDVTRRIDVNQVINRDSAVRLGMPSAVGAPSPFGNPAASAVTPSGPIAVAAPGTGPHTPPVGAMAPASAEASAPGAVAASVNTETDPRRPAPVMTAPGPTSYGLVVGVVVAIIAVIAAGLFLARGSQPGTVQLTTEPTDTSVLVDGKPLPMSSSPFVVSDLEPEVDHRIEVRREGYRSWASTLRVHAGQTLALPTVALTKEEAAPASVSVGAATAADPAPSQVPAQPAIAAPEPEPAAEAEPESEPEPAAAQPSPQKLTKSSSRKSSSRETRKGTAVSGSTGGGGGFGVLRLNSRPWSQVTVDGRAVGNTPQMNLRLSAGAHTIRLHNPQFGLSKTLRLRVKGGQTITKIVDLQ
ncbi:MAG: protein kinase [Myxococcales bacterium]|nr:protein kinase [Myxococcales bacterium]